MLQRQHQEFFGWLVQLRRKLERRALSVDKTVTLENRQYYSDILLGILQLLLKSLALSRDKDMTQILEAVYENGIFRPLQPPNLSDGQIVQRVIPQGSPASECSVEFFKSPMLSGAW
jgi:predicted DNA-binding antitoxin AbrB/MazE fold protein